MRLLYSTVLLIIFVSGCSRHPRDDGPDNRKAQEAAERAIVELEGGEEVPLPGMTPTPGETELLENRVEPAVPEKRVRSSLDYEIKPGWVLIDTAQTFPNSVAPTIARTTVLQAARVGSILKSVPPEVAFTSLLTDIMDETAGNAFEKSTWSTFAVSSITGHLVEEKILSSKLTARSGNSYDYKVILEARVVPVKGQRDPAIALVLTANDRLLADGDELIIRAKASVDGYLYIFDFLHDSSVMLLYPNSFMSKNEVRASEWIEIPTGNERKRGIRYQVSSVPGQATTNETIYAVLTRQPIANLSGLTEVTEGYVSFTAGEESFTQFQRWLAEIPLNQRIEKAIQIHIINNEE